MNVCELTPSVSHPPTGEEHVVQEKPPNEEFDLIWVTSPSQLCGAREIIFSLFYIYHLFCKTSAM
jgi:hypothetical protein